MSTTDHDPRPVAPVKATTGTAQAGLLAPGDWRLVSDSSEIGFLTHLMFGLMPVRGRYSAFEGELHVDPDAGATGELRIDAETISTGIKKRDRHLRSADFFGVELYPHISFELTSLAGADPGEAHLTGTLRIRNRAQPVDTQVSITSLATDEVRIDADFEVDHRSAGFEFKRLPRAVRVQGAVTLRRVS